MKRMFRRLTRARAALIGMATVTIAVAITGVIAQPGSAAALPSSGSGQWPMAGQNISDTHFQAAEHVISPANVSRLTPRWTLTTAGAISATPAVDGGVVYVPDYGGKLWAVQAGSGRVLWSKSISDYTGVPGDQSRVSPAVYRNDIILGDGWIVSANKTGAKVFAVNRRTGALDWVTQVDNDPDAVITAAPTIYRGVAYFGIASKGESELSPTFRGAVVAVNATTGKLLWKAYTVPSNNGNSDSNLANGYYTGNSVWGSSPVVDPARGLLYVGTGNNYTAPAGVCADPGQTNCTQPVADDYVDSILALRLSDGSVAWADHTNNGDIWTVPQPIGPDYDFGAGANLFTVPGTGEQLLGIGQKSGVYWAVNPSTGKVVWQTDVGPTADPGHGIEYGTATDGQRIYVAEGDTLHQPYTIGGSGPYAGQTDTSGSFAALDPATGNAGEAIGGSVRGRDGSIYYDLYSTDPTRSGIWRIPPGGAPERIAAFSPGAFLNGITIDPVTQTLYTCDSLAGTIWSVPTSGGTPTQWLTSPALVPAQSGPGHLGVNGVTFHQGAVWASNTDRGTLLQIPVTGTGAPGPVQVAASNLPGIDDFNFLSAGSGIAFVPLNSQDEVAVVYPDGRSQVVLTAADGLASPTDTFISGTRLYITDGGDVAPHDSKLQEARINLAALPRH